MADAVPLTIGQASESGGGDAPSLVSAPMGKLWSAIPVIAGVGTAVLAGRTEWMEAVFHVPFMATHVARCGLVLVGLVLASSAVPTFFMAVITESPAFKVMLNSVCSCDPAFLPTFVSGMNAIVREAVLHACLMVFVYGLLAWFAFDTVTGIAFGAAVGGANSVIQRAQTRYLDMLLVLCNKDIDTFIDRLSPDSKGEFAAERDWSAIAAAHQELDLRLENLWAPMNGTMFVCPLIARDCMLGGIFLVIGVFLDLPHTKAASWLLGAFLMLRGLSMLRGPAEVTTRCMNSSPRDDGKAIKATVNSIMCHSKSADKDTSLIHFLSYMNNTTTGVEFFGVLVTPAQVAQIGTAMLTNLPIAVGILEGVLKTSKSS